MPLDKVLLGQLPFAVGTAVAIMVAILASTVVGMFVRSGGTQQRPAQARGSGVERFWWRFMRASGVLIVPLVFGHLAMTHILQGVFDITAAGYTVVGTPAAAGVDCAALTIPVMGDGINCTGTAVEFVGERWNLLIGGIAVWKIYDVLLLSLVVIHGFNGLRYVLTDYTSFSPILKRAMIYTTIIGAVTLLTVGAGALVFSITPSAIEMAQEAQCKIGRLTDPLICGEASETAALEGNTTVTIVNPGS
ncbi:MAG: hypothetical protein H7Y11_06590 [Armatimonadetes bacterium]|nr:hypothetical protein [Anaerolineae bacterium]